MHKYEVLTHDDIKMIHENSLKILENVGVEITYDHAKQTLAEHGARVEGNMVYFPRELVEKSIDLAPSSYTIYARDPKNNIEMNLDKTIYLGPNCPPTVSDLDNGRRDGTLEDFINFAKILETLPNIDMLSNELCAPNDTPVEKRHLLMAYNAMKYSSKPFMISVMGYECAKQCIELASIPFGGLEAIKNHPIVAGIPCTLTPLAYDNTQIEVVRIFAELGQVQFVNSLSIAGLTVPATLAGQLAVQNAEILPGIIYAQCINPGTPIIYSAAGSNANMRNCQICIGTPEHALIAIASAQIAKFYKMPCRISGSLTDSKTVDAQAGYESAVTLMASLMAKGNFILHAAGILDSYNCTSYEKLIMDHEVIGYMKRMNRGITVSDETLCYEDVKEIGPNGTFLLTEHTLNNCRTESYQPTLSNRDTYEKWVEDGSKSIEKIANEKWKKILAEYGESSLSKEADAAMLKYIESHSL